MNLKQEIAEFMVILGIIVLFVLCLTGCQYYNAVKLHQQERQIKHLHDNHLPYQEHNHDGK